MEPKPDPSSAALQNIVGLLLFTLASAAGLLLIFEWRVYQQILEPADLPFTFADHVLIAWTAWSKSVALLLPLLLIAGFLVTRHRSKAAWIWLSVSISICVTWLVIDLLLYRDYGRHISNLLDFWSAADAAAYVGGITRWWPTALVGLCSILSTLLFAWGMHRISRQRWMSAITPATRKSRCETLVLLLVLILMPLGLRHYFNREVLFERIFALLPIDPRINEEWQTPTSLEDPVLIALDRELRVLFNNYFPHLTRPVQADASAVFDTKPKPNVILILLESFNAQLVAEGAMPKLAAWGSQGMTFQRHYSGSNHTESGMFTLLFARVPWVYNATLDAAVFPQTCFTFDKSGYRTAFFSGTNMDWLRMTDFIRDRTFSIYDQNYPGHSWAEWDQMVFARLQNTLQASDQPLFALCYLISSHYPYVYPKAYADHPAGHIEASNYPRQLFTPDGLNTIADYHRCLAFLDDEISRAITALDPNKNIIIVTGDHGESLHQDGTFGHYTRFSDAQTRVPLFIVGPGIPRRTVNTATTHADILPTLLHAITSQPVSIAHSNGRDVLLSDPPDEVLICSIHRQGHYQCLAIRGQTRLSFTLSSLKPGIKLRGFEDEMGRVKVRHGQTLADVPAWVSFIKARLDAAVRSISK